MSCATLKILSEFITSVLETTQFPFPTNKFPPLKERVFNYFMVTLGKQDLFPAVGHGCVKKKDLSKFKSIRILSIYNSGFVRPV